MMQIDTSDFELTAEQAAFAARVGADLRGMLASMVPGRVFLYIEEPQRTIRYEVDRDGSVLQGDVFSREGSSGQPIGRPRVSTPDGRPLQL
jgi:hypothetical protein